MKIKSQNGSILLSTLAFIILLATAAASILELTMTSYKLTMRNEMRVQAREVAESELENLYYQAFTQILADQPASLTPTLLGPTGLNLADASVTGSVLPTTLQTPFLASHRTLGSIWRVKRSISYDPAYDYFQGVIPGTTKHGTVTYLTVRVEVAPPLGSYFSDHGDLANPVNFGNSVVVRVGRRFEATKSSIFQYGVFFQGDMELAPGGNIIINGDMAANGSIYAAAQGGGSLTLQGKVRYLSDGYFDKDSTGATVLRKPNTPIAGSLVAPVFSVSQTSQLETLNEPENLVGGVDAQELSARRSDLFPTENDVYRAAILPPPGQTDEYPSVADDPTINAQRMYTRSGVRVTVNTDGTVVVTTPDGAHEAALNAAIVGVVVGTANSPLHDAREGVDVGVTTIDMVALKTALETAYPSNDFNGAIYFNLKSSSAATPKGIKLINGSVVYGLSGKGFTVTTNGGVYVQGDYNTKLDGGLDNWVGTGPTDPLRVGINPAMIMGDQVTVLSQGWVDSNAIQDKYHRVATGDIIIQAGILTGNTPASSSVASGGVQSLVRYEEMWGGRSVSFFGSMGRLFDSKTFWHTWGQPGLGDVYGSPASRTFTFDPILRDHPPAGSPTTTSFLRGSFFVWTP
ncbi:MAG: hypothetical protein ABI222_14015 [Opitutaceae bacterium]